MSRKVDLVCPICFDFGFTQTSLRSSVMDDATQSMKAKMSGLNINQPQMTGDKIVTEDPSNEANSAPQIEEPAEISQADTRGGKSSSSASPFPIAEIMQHKYDRRIDDIFTLSIDLDTVEPKVSRLLEGNDPQSEEDWWWAFAKAELIKNRMIPFKYWLEQPCPAHRHEENNTSSPCVSIRRGLHDYLLETNPEYAAKQDLMLKLGYVSTAGSGASQCIRVGHLEVGEISASGWAVEGFLQDGIPSPWRRPWYPDRGLVVFERPVTSGDTASDEAFQKATNWFRECNDTHPGCSSGETPQLPDRVLDIAADTASGVRLVRTDNKKARYACLSHRWAGETPRTTTENIESLCMEIPWNFLSTTYQDAVTFLRKFSKWHQEQYGEAIRYIWIDSLCIMQDSPSDWTEHSLKMSDVYSNSSLTLLESHRLENEKRLFHKASPMRAPKSIPVRDALGQDHDFYYRSTLHHPDFMVRDEAVPIWTRAWVFQERLLSRRLLIFGSEELSWQCSVHNKCECGLDELEGQSHKLMTEWEHDIHVRSPSASSRKNLHLILGDNPSQKQLRMAWRLIVEAYSQLEFTYRKDTLYAITGLAKSFNARLGGKKYFAGIWYDETAEGELEVDDMAETSLDLLWRLAYYKDAERKELSEPAVPISWSWAYPECSIVYPFAHDEALSYYSLVANMSSALKVPKLPDDHEVPRGWLDDMYTEAPPSAIAICGPLWKTQILASEIWFRIKDTDYQEYCYFLGAMSASIYQEAAFGRPISKTRALILPPAEENESTEDTFQRMPPIVFYPDNLNAELSGPVFCLPIAKFKRLPVKSGLEEKVVFAALVLVAVGHKATTEGFDPDLDSKDPGDLVYQRLGLAYTTDGGWEDEHDEIVAKFPVKAIRIVQ